VREVVDLYRPSSGSEGARFMAVWCDRCVRDAAFRANPDAADGCPIAADTMAYEVGEPGYPREWRYLDDEPICTAFEPEPAA
jgi:hypothetical protein